MSDQTTDIDVMAVNLLQRERIAELEKDLALTNKYADSVHRENNSLRSDLAEANELVDAYRLMEKEWRRIDGERRLLDAHVSTSCQ